MVEEREAGFAERDAAARELQRCAGTGSSIGKEQREGVVRIERLIVLPAGVCMQSLF